MRLRFKDRIALFTMLASAAITGFVFIVVYKVVYFSSFRHLDNDIREEQADVYQHIRSSGDTLLVDAVPEWEEQEHKRTEVNPTFIQIEDKNNKLIFKSENLGPDRFPFIDNLNTAVFFNTLLRGKEVRIGQIPLRDGHGNIYGQMAIAVSEEEARIVLNNLQATLVIAYPLALLVLYLVTALAVSKGIAPVKQLIVTAGTINDATLDTRMPLPPNKDEIYQLATAMNELLERIEQSIRREKQFTADASHELRTPMAAIRGTLEVLIRKQREPAHYENKIKQVITGVDRLTMLMEQLLQLARLESGAIPFKKTSIQLSAFLNNTFRNWQGQLNEKALTFHNNLPESVWVVADPNLMEIITANLMDNAIKYVPTGGNIWCLWDAKTNSFLFKDDGLGISDAHLPHLFDRFYRTDGSRNSSIPGTGLGLSIVKKLCDLQQIKIDIESKEGEGCVLRFQFNQYSA